MSKIAHLFTGGFLGDGREVRIPAPPPPGPDRIRMMFRQAWQDLKVAERHMASCQEKVRAIRELALSLSGAHRRALAEEMLQADPPPAPQRTPAPLVRVRVLEGFSTEWDGLPYDAPHGSVVDIPRALAVAAPHMFEILDDQETPLHRAGAGPR